MRETAPATVPGLRPDALYLPAGALPEVRPAPLRVRKAEEGEGEAGGRQGADHPAHDDDELLASRRYAHVRPAVHGTALRQTAGLLQKRSGTPGHLERTRHAQEALAGARREGLRA